MESLTKAEIGQRGELLAVKWLKKNSFKILDTNWRSGQYELDIVARKRGVVHFIEVKTRLLGGMTTPEEAMTARKVNAFLKAARCYMSNYRIKEEVQFGLIAVDTLQNEEWRVRYIENAVEFRW